MPARRKSTIIAAIPLTSADSVVTDASEKPSPPAGEGGTRRAATGGGGGCAPPRSSRPAPSPSRAVGAGPFLFRKQGERKLPSSRSFPAPRTPDFPLPARTNRLGHFMTYDAAASEASWQAVDVFLAAHVR